MPDFSAQQRLFVDSAYAAVDGQIERLDRASQNWHSDLRRELVDELSAHQSQIANVGFFDEGRDYFSDGEIEAILAAASQINELIVFIDDLNALTLTRFEMDLARTIQGIALDEYDWLLNLAWLGARRNSRLPAVIPDEVRDAFSVGHFTLAQGQFNQRATRMKEVAVEGCLNDYDYPESQYKKVHYNTAKASATNAVDDHVRLQRLKASEQEAARQRNEESLGVGGAIWAVVGWESPSDFLKDVVITAVFGGGTAVRWMNRMKKVEQRIARAKKLTKELWTIKDEVRKAEKRVDAIRDNAAKIRRAKQLSEIPKKVAAPFKELQEAKKQAEQLQNFKKQLPGSYFRAAVSGATANLLADRRTIGAQLTEEVTRKAVLDYIAGTAFGKEIERRRDIINVKTLLARKLSPTGLRLLNEYVILVWFQEIVVRMTISKIHKQSLDRTAVVEHLIASTGAAAERILLDLGVIPRSVVKVVTEGVISFARKTLFEFLQVVAREAMS